MNNIDKKLDELLPPYMCAYCDNEPCIDCVEARHKAKESLKALMNEFKDAVIGEDKYPSINIDTKDIAEISKMNLRKEQRFRANDLLNRSSK